MLSKLVAGLSALVLAALLAATAHASQPWQGEYAHYKADGEMLIRFHVTAAKRISPMYYNDCSQVPVVYKITVDHQGRFSFRGTKDNIAGEPVKIELAGQFVSKGKAKGTVRYSADDCTGTARTFVATFQD